MHPVVPPGPPRHRLGGYREYAPPDSLAPVAESLWVHRAPDELPAGAAPCIACSPILH